eukprot:CAMPEP_0119262772 /NCGR_PEP_ID=MMETSP1329-20130426/2393_1 /TAXON_ID=114041 /ORGANISM="Genus nov. species nov., Strain RCC1024" /LENGTH=104 /DNA_ID=CAMNT_0007262447 /DNA_START=195 /DNA_END=507 /DNA_ORIENTATION=-
MKHIVAFALLAARAASQDTAAAPKQRRLRFGTYKDEAPPVVAITESPSAEPAVAPTAEPSLAPTAQCKQSGEPAYMVKTPAAMPSKFAAALSLVASIPLSSCKT